MLQVKNLVKTYKTKKADTVYALKDVSIDFADNGLVFLLGKSGSGKSTLLNAIGGLDKFDSGEIIIKGKSSKDFTQSDFDSYRNTFIGFIFQEYNILENFSVAKNLELALELQGKKASKEEVNNLLSQVEMLDYANRNPNQLSGGQKQRVAIARALIKNPEIIMADEPTGALDSNTGKQVMETLKSLSKTKLVIIVSHDREFAEQYGDRIIELKDGKIIRDVTKKEIEANVSPSGVKIIDNNLIYIKKGQPISDEEIKNIASIIKAKSQTEDMFLSFDNKANSKLKEGAGINEDGNKEKFVKTESEDIKSKEYNGKDLKLIKSHLKFSDSFKMGASSLKNKVAKLVFTIILSFFAFTVFGVVDTFSTWNRGASVYQSLRYDNAQSIVFTKEKKMDTYNKTIGVSKKDIEDLQAKFPHYQFSLIYGGDSWIGGHSFNLRDYTLESTSNPLWCLAPSGAIVATNESLQKLGYTIEGRLPENDEEIAISKHLWSVIQKKSSATSWQDLKLSGYFSSYLTLVGIVDDKTDLSIYENMTDQQIQQDYTINQLLAQSPSNFIYLSQKQAENYAKGNSNYNNLSAKCNETDSTYGVNISNFTTSKKMYDLFKMSYLNANFVDTNNITDEINAKIQNKFLEENLLYFKGGKENYFKNGEPYALKGNEIIIHPYDINGIDNIENYKQKIENGTLKILISEDYEFKTILREYTIVGLLNYNCPNGSCVSENELEYIDYNLNKKSGALVNLLGNSEDESLIKHLETANKNRYKFPIQNKATATLNMLENISGTLTSILFYVAIAFAVFASLLLMNFIATSISYKKREIGVLRALGARGSDIFGIFLNESTIISLINFALSTIATFVICTVVNKIIINKLGYTIVLLTCGIRQMALILAISWGSAFLASLIPSIRISKKRPIDAINNR